MNRHKRQVSVPVEHPSRGPLAKERFKDGEALSWPPELEAEEDLQNHGNDAHHNCSHQELLGDHLVVVAEDVLRNEALFVVCVSSHV